MNRIDGDGVIRLKCHSLSPALVNGAIQCSTWAAFDDINTDDVLSDDFDGIEAQFPLAMAVTEIVERHAYHDGKVALEAKPTLSAMRAELERMIAEIDAVEYASE